MQNVVERFVRLASGRLLWLNLIALFVIKFALPYAGGGLADIASVLQPMDTDIIVAQTNVARASAAVTVLKRSAVLDRAAQAKLDDMAAKGYFAHISPTGTRPWDFLTKAGYSYRTAGENLARGFTDPAAVVAAWLNSSTHRQNITNPAYREIGVAARRVIIDGRSSVVVVQMFATPLPAAVKQPVPVPRINAIQPVRVTVPATAAAQIGRALSGALGLYLSGLIALLIAAIGVVGFKRTHLRALVVHGALLALALALPAATAGYSLIF